VPNQFIVPQFIEVEDKILGPITVRQFVTILAGAIFMVIDYQLLFKAANQPGLFLLSGLGVLIGVVAVAFVKVNGRPFHLFILNVLQSLKNPHRRIWNNEITEKLEYWKEPPPPTKVPSKHPMTATKLAKLALLVDTAGAYHEEDNTYWGQALPGARTPAKKNEPK
jgi:hypothetical protein